MIIGLTAALGLIGLTACKWLDLKKEYCYIIIFAIGLMAFFNFQSYKNKVYHHQVDAWTGHPVWTNNRLGPTSVVTKHYRRCGVVEHVEEDEEGVVEGYVQMSQLSEAAPIQPIPPPPPVDTCKKNETAKITYSKKIPQHLLMCQTTEICNNLTRDRVGTGNPRLSIPPEVSPRLYDDQHWRSTNYNSLSTLADHKSHTDLFLKGDSDVNTACNTVEVEFDKLYRVEPPAETCNTDCCPPPSDIGLIVKNQFVMDPEVMKEYGSQFITPFNSLYGITAPSGQKQDCPRERYIEVQTGPQDVYDPRHTGYADGECQYDEISGTTKWDYSDVDAVRRPVFSRSKLDFLGDRMSDSIGDNRKLAEEAWTQAALQHRQELSSRLMRVGDARAAQRHQFPVY